MTNMANKSLTNNFRRVSVCGFAAAILAACAGTATAFQSVPDRVTAQSDATYADLVTLAERSDLVIRAAIRDQIVLKPERAPDLSPGFARLYIEAETLALIAGSTPVGKELAYLVDVPLDADGDPPEFEDREVVLFANPVPGRPGTIQLVGPGAQLAYSPTLESRLRPILTELVGPDVPPRVSGIGDALAVAGTLTGESETQIFLDTQDGSPVSLSILRRPGRAPTWGASWGEIVDSTARPPAPRTLRWYRLACSLPEELPSSVNLARDPTTRALAEQDYALVIDELGSCERVLTADY